MTAINDLYAEDIPTRPEPAPSRPRPYTSMWTRAEQDQHWQELCAAVGTPDAQRPRKTPAARQNAA
ncbi:hypothetical protein [Streptomyces sp. NPDC020298]|uniref:hypothetical protein n=1 Tax=unclassified Streptomyces TaxID=2593676 RepID=UPI0033CE40A2